MDHFFIRFGVLAESGLHHGDSASELFIFSNSLSVFFFTHLAFAEFSFQLQIQPFNLLTKERHFAFIVSDFLRKLLDSSPVGSFYFSQNVSLAKFILVLFEASFTLFELGNFLP